MRSYFSSQKRVSNVARLIRRELGSRGVDFSEVQLREVVSVASGFRNYNELLKSIDAGAAPSPADEDVSPEEAYERAEFFVRKLASRLAIDYRTAREVYDAVKPFSGATFSPRLSEAKLREISAKIAREASSITPTVPQEMPGDWLGVEIKFSRRSVPLTIQVSSDGDLNQSEHEALSSLLWAGGIAHERKSSVRPFDGDEHLLNVLSRLDRKALFVLRAAKQYDDEVYAAAREVPDGSAWIRAVATYPRLGRKLAWALSAGKYDAVRFSDSDPMSTVVREVVELSQKKWPSAAVDLARAEAVTRRYMSLATEDDGYVSLVPAFLMHMPDSIQPRTGAAFKKAEEFLFSRSKIFETYSLAISPATFGSEMAALPAFDWKLDKKIDVPIDAMSVAAAVIAQAAREVGYPTATAGQFEEPEDEGLAESMFQLGASLIAEKNLGYASGLRLAEAQKHQIRMRVDEWMQRHKAGLPPETDEESAVEDAEDYVFLAGTVLHERHSGRPAMDILVDHGMDIHEFVADASDYGSPLYEATSRGGRTIFELGDMIPTVVSVVAEWSDPKTGAVGTEVVEVALPRQLHAILKPSRYKYARSLGDFVPSGTERITGSFEVRHGLKPREKAAAAARELRFMAATGLVPSKRSASPGEVGSEFPDLDHQTTWTEPKTGATVFVSEPYHAYEGAYEEWAEDNKSFVVVSKWPGMYMPGFTKLIMISDIEHRDMLLEIERRLSALNAL
jgi:hypothetical protein